LCWSRWSTTVFHRLQPAPHEGAMFCFLRDDVLLTGGEYFSLHEYAHGVVDEVYEGR